MRKRTTIVHAPEYANWRFSDDHPTQGRRFINGFNAMPEIFHIARPRPATVEELSRVHSLNYIEDVIERGLSYEWSGERKDLGEMAALFAGGTLTALELLLKNQADVVIHLPGGKHHAKKENSSGFCIFNDFALAAEIATKDHGLKVAILDIDAHHGDGVEGLTFDNKDVLTFSIHESGIFPGTGNESNPSNNAFNYPLTEKTGKGDSALMAGIKKFLPIARAFAPDLLFITSGADGLAADPLSQLQYSIEGYAAAARLVADELPATPILMGGAGGYLPDDGTPSVWAAVAGELAR